MEAPYRTETLLNHEKEQALLQKLRELRAMDAERAAIEIELREIQEDNQKRRLKLLGNVRLAAKCNVDWDTMKGSEVQRFCNQCKESVTDLSAMTEVQAALFVESASKKGACVRFYQRHDGTILTKDCPDGLKARTRRNRIFAAIGVGIGLLSSPGIINSFIEAHPNFIRTHSKLARFFGIEQSSNHSMSYYGPQPSTTANPHE
jgi:hypothetical protein